MKYLLNKLGWWIARSTCDHSFMRDEFVSNKKVYVGYECRNCSWVIFEDLEHSQKRIKKTN